MAAMRFLFIVVICLYSVGFGYSRLPQLKWVKNINNTTIVPNYIIDFSAERFLCVDAGNIVVMNAADGTLAAKVTGFSKLASITKAIGDNFVIAEGNKITLLDSSLEAIWSKPILNNLSISHVIQTSDSGFAAIGKAADSTMIIKTDKKGDTLWTRSVSNTCTVMNGKRIIEVDGGFIAGGECCIEPCLWANGWIKKYSYTGTEGWTKIITGLTMYDMIPVSNGVVLTGSIDLGTDTMQPTGLTKTLRFPDTHIPIINIDADGALLVNTSLSGLIGLNWGNTVRKIDSTFIFACYMSSYENPMLDRVMVNATNEAGKIKWQQQYSYLSRYNRPIAQPLSTGDLVVFALDSLYYYSDPTSFRSTHQIGTPLIRPNITIKQNRLFFTLDKTSQVQVTLHAMDGRIVHRFGEILLTSGQHSLTLPGIARGAYVLRLTYNRYGNVQKTILFR